MLLNVVDFMNDGAKKFQDWIIANQSNPILWIGLFFGGLLIFYMVYSALHKN